MPRVANQTPSYRIHKASGQAIVVLSGRMFYLGVPGSVASRREYDRVVSEWIANGRQLRRDGSGTDITVAELVNAFRKFVKTYYTKGGQPTSEVESFKYALKPVFRLYADTPAGEFGPLALKAVREEMIRAGWVRTSVNRQIGRVRQMFKWAAENEMIPPSIYHGLTAVNGLRRGRSEAKEAPPVRPVPDAYVDAIKPYVTTHVWGMIQLQRFTGARPGEVVSIRGRDIDTNGPIWEYVPAHHKTEHHDRKRIIPLGPQAQALIRQFLRANLAEPLFNPREAHAERCAAKAQSRRRPDQKPTKRKTKRAMGEAYDVHSYRRAIVRGCQLANEAEQKKRGASESDEVLIPTWHPHQLRHNFATAVRKRFGLEVARAALAGC